MQDKKIYELSALLVHELTEKKLKIASAESLTGGMISELITSVSGSSAVFECGICSYSNRIKHEVLGVSEKTLEEYTEYSFKTAEEMEVLYNSKGHDIILDLSKLEYISSSGLRLFLNLVKETRPNGSHIFVVGASEHIRQVFAMTGFMRIFEFK